MLRIPLLAVALLAVVPAAAQAGPCQPGSQHPTLQAVFEDLSLNKNLPGPPTVVAGHRIGIDGRFPDAGVGGRDGVIAGSLKIDAPGVPTTKQSGGYLLAVVPQAAGTVPVTFSWTESRDPTAASPVATCDGSATVDVNVLEAKPPTISLRRVSGSHRLDLRLALSFPRTGDASAITMQARAVGGSNPPKTGLKRIAALSIDGVTKGLHHTIGSGSFGRAELNYSATASGGLARIRWTGTRRTGALSVDLVQSGRVRARLRTRVVCSRSSCRAVGLRFTKP
jgi:hypothetical protein